jgi:hypothetical protein
MSPRRTALAIVAAFAVVAIGFFGFRWQKKRSTKTVSVERVVVLPLPPDRLPRDTQWLSRTTPAKSEPPLPGDDRERWSKLAGSEYCGGYDVFHEALAAADPRTSPRELVRILALPPKDLRAALGCGKTLARASARDSHRIRFGAVEKEVVEGSYLVSFDAFAIDALPTTSSFVKPIAALGGLELGRCRVGPYAHAGAECLPGAATSARVPKTKTWVSGELEAVRAFGAGLAQDSGSAVKVFERLGNELEAFSSVSVHRNVQDLKQDWMTGIWSEPFAIMSGSPQLEALDSALKDKYWTGAVASNEAPSFEYRAVIISISDTSAEAIARALRHYLAEVVKRLGGDVPRRLSQGNVPEAVLGDEWQRTSRARRAWRLMSVAHKRDHVTLTTNRTPTDDEARAMKQYEAWILPKRKAAGHLVDTLLEAKPPERADLITLGGEGLVASVAKGYRPYFEGEWHCIGSNKRERDLSIKTDQYTHQLAYDSYNEPTEVRIGTDANAETLRVHRNRSGMWIRDRQGVELGCRRTDGAGADELESPGDVRFELPKPLEGSYYTPTDPRALRISHRESQGDALDDLRQPARRTPVLRAAGVRNERRLHDLRRGRSDLREGVETWAGSRRFV